MRELCEVQNRIVYQGRAGMQNNPFAYPIHQLELDCRLGHDSFVSVTFIAENLFRDDLRYFILSMVPWLAKLGFVVLPEIFDYVDSFEFQICHMKYSGDLSYRSKEDIFSLMTRVAAILGSSSIQNFTVKIPKAVVPLDRFDVNLRLAR